MPPPEPTALDFTGLVQCKGISSHQADPQECKAGNDSLENGEMQGALMRADY